MKNVFLTFVLLAFLTPAGSAFGQPAATVTFTNPREALAYNELSRVCGITRQFAIYLISQYEKDSGAENKQSAKKSLVLSKTGDKEDTVFANTLVEMVFTEKKTSTDVYINCMMKGKALHPAEKRKIMAIFSENVR